MKPVNLLVVSLGIAVIVVLGVVAWPQAQSQTPGTPPAWQYHTLISLDAPPADTALAELGQAGWELISVVAIPSIQAGGGVQHRVYVTFRRQSMAR
jgi:hypothetical protein